MSTNANKKNEMCLLPIAVGNLLCQNLFRVTQGINVKYENIIPIMFQEVGRSICNVLSFIIFSVFLFYFYNTTKQKKKKNYAKGKQIITIQKNHSTVSASLLLSMRD